ncbi:MAG: hypothetical protein NZM44_02450 [Candidatus Calescibacterium sp.]|nr:hypothetical protein [Candidatus Calescibacterium sp.]
MKLLRLIMIALIIMSISFAGIKKGEINTDTLNTKQVNTYIYNVNVHKVVAGQAAFELGPTFLRNDWDRIDYGSWSNLTREELNYLDTITGLSNGVWHYIDVTGRVYLGNSMPQDIINIRTEINIFEEGDFTIIENKHITEGIDYQLVLQVYDYSPIILDLDKNKKVDVAYGYWLPHAPKFFQQNIVSFDITGDGTKDLVEWVVGPNDGLLVAPESKTVESALDLFGTAGGFSDGYEKLKRYDKDKNGFIEGNELKGFKLWIDRNMNAKVDSGELIPVQEYNISKISTHHNGKYVSYYETTEGKKYLMWDWWPAAIQVKAIRK